MSSTVVRQGFIDFLTDVLDGDEKLVDLTSTFDELQDLLEANDIGVNEKWTAIQFVGSEEVPVDVRGANNRGKYRETGVVYIHIVDVSSLNVHTKILERAEIIRNAFRGQRIADKILIETVTPPNFGGGITLSFTGGYTACIIQIDYQFDLDL